MELLTGKCRLKFEKWYRKEFKERNLPYFDMFVMSDISIKYSLLVDFFDISDIKIEVQYFYESRKYYEYSIFNCGWIHVGDFKTREEGRVKAIKKANELYNQKHK